MSQFEQTPISFTCQGQANRSYTVAVGPLTLVGPAGTKVVDNFTYAGVTSVMILIVIN